jgi:hypothetical protein
MSIVLTFFATWITVVCMIVVLKMIWAWIVETAHRHY